MKDKGTVFIQGLRSGKTVEYLLQYITNCIEETKNNNFWEFDLNGKEFEHILINNICIDDKLFFSMLNKRITEIIGNDINIYWSENIIERGKKISIERMKNNE